MLFQINKEILKAPKKNEHLGSSLTNVHIVGEDLLMAF